MDKKTTVFAQRLRELRKNYHYTQAYVCSQLNYGESAISSYELGKNEPTFSDLIKLAQFYHVSADYLCGLTNIPNPNSKECTLFLQIYNELSEDNRRTIELFMNYQIDKQK